MDGMVSDDTENFILDSDLEIPALAMVPAGTPGTSTGSPVVVSMMLMTV